MNRIKEVLDEKGIKQTWLAEKLEKSYNMVNSYVRNRRQPSLDDLYKIAKILGVDVRNLLVNNKAEDIVENEFKEDNITPIKTVDVPLVGSAACGLPILAEQNIETYIPVSVKLAKPSNKYFLLRAKGNSMNEAGISNGNLVLVKQQYRAENGDRVVALIDDEATIKEYYNKGDTIVLKPKSTEKKHQPIILTRDFKIQGIVIAVIPI